MMDFVFHWHPRNGEENQWSILTPSSVHSPVKTIGSATPGISSSPVMPTSPDSPTPILALEDVEDTIQAVQANRVALGLEFDQEC